MSPLTKFDVLQFVDKAHAVTKAMAGDTVAEIAIKVGRMQVLTELMELANMHV